MSSGILNREFYAQDTVVVAQKLLGRILTVKSEHGTIQGRIVETEAYLTGDPASHTFRGKTARNAVMFGPAGHAYVYFSYGSHYMLNFVSASEGLGEAVLIRALEPVAGIDLMRHNRVVDTRTPDWKLCAGPGRLAKALGITRSAYNGLDLCNPDSLITVIDAPEVESSVVIASPRIGISQGTEHLWRYYVNGCPAVSRR